MDTKCIIAMLPLWGVLGAVVQVEEFHDQRESIMFFKVKLNVTVANGHEVIQQSSIHR